MKNERLLKPILCQGKDLADSLNIYVEKINGLPGTFDHKETIGTSVIIWYREEQKQEKPMWRMMRDKGFKHCCGECRHLIRRTKKDGTVDKRKAYCPCELLGCTKRSSDYACDAFYLEMLEQIDAAGIKNASPKAADNVEAKIGA